jgi:hypothetical protein
VEKGKAGATRGTVRLSCCAAPPPSMLGASGTDVRGAGGYSRRWHATWKMAPGFLTFGPVAWR